MFSFFHITPDARDVELSIRSALALSPAENSLLGLPADRVQSKWSAAKLQYLADPVLGLILLGVP